MGWTTTPGRDPSDEELARDWTLSARDREQVERSRGDRHRLYFALQLCALRRKGQFVDETTAPVRILNHLARQLELPPVLFLEGPQRRATRALHHDRLRRYVGYRSFDDTVEQRLRTWLQRHAGEAMDADLLLARAERQLHVWRVVPPGRSTLERMVAAVAADTEETLFESVVTPLSPATREMLDRLLLVAPARRASPFAEFKEDPPEAKPAVLLRFLERLGALNELLTNELDQVDVAPTFVEQRAHLARRYDADDLKRFAPTKRYALLSCFLLEARPRLYDHLVALHDQYVTGLTRRARNAYERRYRKQQRRRRRSLDTVLSALETLLAVEDPDERSLGHVLKTHNVGALRTAVATCRRFQQLEDEGHLDELRNRHSHLKRYLPTFFELPFRAERGSEHLLIAAALALQLHRGELAELPADAPAEFVPAGWRRARSDRNGHSDRRIWEVALAVAYRDALRSGDLYLPDSRHHVSFWNLVYDEKRWQAARPAAYEQLGLPGQAAGALERLQAEYHQAANRFVDGLDANPFATLQAGRLKLKRPDALEISPGVRQLRRVLETHLPRVRIETLLVDVDRLCGFTRAFRPLLGYRSQGAPERAALLASLVAHGTNLGLATMGQSTDGIPVDALQHVSQWFLRNDSLKDANTVLVDFHHRMPLSATWGDGTVSSSDGQRFGIQASSVLASFYPRYFGYYDRALTVYTHTSDQHSVFASRAISCAPREALYVLDGLLENDTILDPQEHTTDTVGATEQLFGLCFLLGFSFMPRLRDLADQQLYKPANGVCYGPLEPLLRSAPGTELLHEQWDQLVRLAASLRHRTAPAHVIVQRLASSARSDRLAKALTALGRLVKSLHILRYLHDGDLRHRIQLQLNRGEGRHKLARRLFFANQGRFRTADYEEIMNKVSALSLLSNAVLVWNTLHVAEILERFEAEGNDVDPADLAHISPLAHRHVIPNGTYRFQQAVARSS